ncbi:MAG: hypothetical protein Q9186_002191 [Xanthomendoza sp. 1 TL-2023]
MPNKYSHAFVLSRYEAKGFITLPHPPITPPPASSLCSDFDLHVSSSSSSNTVGTPSLNAVPVLSDSSTTSTASSLDDPVREPLHSASSSIVTKIYAPQSPVIVTTPPTVVPVEDRPKEVLPSPPPEKQLERQPLPEPPKSRFSSSYDLSSFISRHSSVARSRKRPSRKYRHLSRGESPNPSQISISQPAKPNSHTIDYPSQQPILCHPPTQQSKHQTPFEHLEPTFNTDSLEDLSLEDIALEDLSLEDLPLEDLENEKSQSRNIDVLPWEYPETQSALPPVYRPRGFPPTNSPTFHTPSNRTSQILSPPNPPSRDHQVRPKSSQISSLASSIEHSPSSSSSTHLAIFSTHDQPSTSEHYLSHQHSDESFDSAAPPPIRITPRQLPTAAALDEQKGKEKNTIGTRENGLRMSVNGAGAQGMNMGMGMGKERVRIRTKGRVGRG